MRHPLGNHLARTTGLRDAEGERTTVEEPRESGCRADQRIAVRRIGNRAVDHRLDAHGGEDWYALAGGLDVFLESSGVIIEQLVGELIRNALQPMRPRLPLVGPEYQAVPLLAQVVADVRVAHQRQPRRAARHEFGDVLGHQILVGERHHRQVLTDHGRHFTAPVAGCVDHRLRRDHALVGRHAPFARGRARDGSDARVAVDLRARIARALGQRLRHLRRVDVAVERIVQPGDDTVRFQERMVRADLCRGQHLEFDTLGAGLRDHVPELIDPLGGVRQTDAARDVVVDLVTDARGQFRIQPGAVALQLDQVPGGREIRAVARSMPGGTGGQLIALEQHRVSDPELRQMIKSAAAD